MKILPTEHNKKVGAHVKWLRDEAGLTQPELAIKLGTSSGYISQIETGLSGMAYETSQKMAQILDVPHFALLDPDLDEKKFEIMIKLYRKIKGEQGLDKLPAIEILVDSM